MASENLTVYKQMAWLDSCRADRCMMLMIPKISVGSYFWSLSQH